MWNLAFFADIFPALFSIAICGAIGIGVFWAIFGHFLGRRKAQIVLLAACGVVIVWAIADRSMLTVVARRFGLAGSFFQFGVCLILCVILGVGRSVIGHLPQRAMKWFGEFSYSLYIVHYPILLLSLSLLQRLIAGSPRKSAAGAVLAIAAAIAISYLSARLFERKAMFEAATHWLTDGVWRKVKKRLDLLPVDYLRSEPCD